MIKASIDIGSNSVLLLAVEWNGKIVKELLNFSYITSLGKDLDKTKNFHPDSLKATYDALVDYKNKLEKLGVLPKDVTITATEAARVATNSKEFFLKVKDELGFNVSIISADKEAYYTALGVVSGVESDANELIIMDIGGASTELIKIKKNPFEIISSISLPVGSVRATDWKNENIFEHKMQDILSTPMSNYKTSTMICVAGSMTSLATMFLDKKEFNDKAIDGMDINFTEFKKFQISLLNLSTQELLLKYPFLGKRAPMVAAGAHASAMILEKLDVKTIKVSTRGLRYGIIFSC